MKRDKKKTTLNEWSLEMFQLMEEIAAKDMEDSNNKPKGKEEKDNGKKDKGKADEEVGAHNFLILSVFQ